MANTSRINGFRPVKHVSGAPYNGQFNTYVLLAADATDTFVGDLVIITGTADATGVYPSVKRASASDPAIVGAIVGFEVDPTTLNSAMYRVASTLRKVYVADAPGLVFEAEADGGGAELAITDIGSNVNILSSGTGSSVTGQSAMQIDSSTATTTATLPLKLIGFSSRVDNVIGADAKALVTINSHVFGGGTGSVGI